MQAALDATALALVLDCALSPRALSPPRRPTISTGSTLAPPLTAPTISVSYSNVINPQLVMSATATVRTFSSACRL
jgi:hypothetical protein